MVTLSGCDSYCVGNINYIYLECSWFSFNLRKMQLRHWGFYSFEYDNAF